MLLKKDVHKHFTHILFLGNKIKKRSFIKNKLIELQSCIKKTSSSHQYVICFYHDKAGGKMHTITLTHKSYEIACSMLTQSNFELIQSPIYYVLRNIITRTSLPLDMIKMMSVFY